MPFKLLALCLALLTLSARAEEQVPGSFFTAQGIKINGSLDFNYVYNFNNPQPVSAPTSTNLEQPAAQNRYRAFDIYHDDFNLALAELTIQRTQGDIGFFVSLDFGHTADVMSPNDEVTKHIAQAYLTYKPHAAPEFSITAGKMYTHLGLEYIKTKEDWNYSRSLLFAYALPYWHTGVAAHYSFLGDKLVPSVYLYNQTAGVYENNRSHTVGAQLKAVPAKDLQLYYNFLSGVENSADGESHARTIHEGVATYKLWPSLEFAGDVVYGQLTKVKADDTNGEWFAWSAALRWTRGWFSLSPRFEIFWDRSGAAFELASVKTNPLPQRVQSATLTAAFDCGDGLETRLEFRQDHSSHDSFLTSGTNMVGTQNTATVGLLYDF